MKTFFAVCTTILLCAAYGMAVFVGPDPRLHAAPSVEEQQTLLQQSALAADADFVSRVKIAAVAAAIAISNESDQTPNHVNRVALARQVVSSALPWATQIAVGVAADTSITSAASDAVISARVAAIWNTYAGQ